MNFYIFFVYWISFYSNFFYFYNFRILKVLRLNISVEPWSVFRVRLMIRTSIFVWNWSLGLKLTEKTLKLQNSGFNLGNLKKIILVFFADLYFNTTSQTQLKLPFFINKLEFDLFVLESAQRLESMLLSGVDWTIAVLFICSSKAIY